MVRTARTGPEIQDHLLASIHALADSAAQLNERQLAELRTVSSRVRITPTSFVNTYDLGRFRGNRDRSTARNSWYRYSLTSRLLASLFRSPARRFLVVVGDLPNFRGFIPSSRGRGAKASAHLDPELVPLRESAGAHAATLGRTSAGMQRSTPLPLAPGLLRHTSGLV